MLNTGSRERRRTYSNARVQACLRNVNRTNSIGCFQHGRSFQELGVCICALALPPTRPTKTLPDTTRWNRCINIRPRPQTDCWTIHQSQREQNPRGRCQRRKHNPNWEIIASLWWCKSTDIKDHSVRTSLLYPSFISSFNSLKSSIEILSSFEGNAGVCSLKCIYRDMIFKACA